MKRILAISVIVLLYGCGIYERAMGVDCHKTVYAHELLGFVIYTEEYHDHEQCILKKMQEQGYNEVKYYEQ